MRRTFTVTVIVLLLVHELLARGKNNWENVKRLPVGSAVQILLWNGEDLRGRIDNVSDAGLLLAMVERFQTRRVRQLDRSGIRRIAQFHQPNLPDPKRWMVTGAVAGGAIGLTAGAVADGRHGTNYRWFEGAFGGAGMGFLASTMALVAVGTFDVAKGPHRSKVVYEDTSSHPPDGERENGRPSP